MNKYEVLKDAIAAYSHANNLAIDISKKSWMDYLSGKTEDDKIRNYIGVQMGLCKRIIDAVIGEDSKLYNKPSIFLTEIDELIKKLEKHVK